MIINLRIKNLRESHSLTQEQISKRLKINRKTYSDYEIQRISIPVPLLVRLAEFYNVSIGYLCGVTNDSTPYPNKLPFDNDRMIRIIKDLRIQYQYTQKQLSNLLPCGHNTISQYETGKRMVPLEIIICLSKIYLLPLDYIIGVIEIKREIVV